MGGVRQFGSGRMYFLDQPEKLCLNFLSLGGKIFICFVTQCTVGDVFSQFC